MGTPKSALPGWLARYAAGLRFPTLLAIMATLFVLDLLIPDLVPLADEILLGLFTILLAGLRKRRPSAGATDAEPLPDRRSSAERR